MAEEKRPVEVIMAGLAFEPRVVAIKALLDSHREKVALLKETAEALEHANEWLEIEGCDCGTDEPGTCALCEASAALSKLRAAGVLED